MTIKELIAKLQEFPEETLVRFQADQGHIDTDEPLIELGGGGAEDPTFLFIDIDG